MNRLARILFLVSLISAAGLAMLSLNTHADPNNSTPRTQTAGGGNAQKPRESGALTDSAPVKFNLDDLIEDYSDKVLKEVKAGKVPNAIGRELEIAQAERGTDEKSGSVLFLGDNRSGKSTVVKAIAAERTDFRIWRLKLETLYEMDSKAEQSSAIKKVILGLEKKHAENPHTKDILYIDNVTALNQGASVEVRPINSIIEAIASRRGVPMWIETDGPTNRDVFMSNASIYDRMTVDEVKSAKFDAVVFHLRSMKSDIERTYGVIIHDSTLAETARLSVRFYTNNPFDAAESLLKNAAHRTAQELKGNSTEAMRTRSELIQLQAEKQSILTDIQNDPSGQYEETPGQHKKRLQQVENKIAELSSKASSLTKSDPTLAATIEEMRREKDEKVERLAELEGRKFKNSEITQEYNRLEQEIENLTTRMRNAQLADKEIRESGIKPSKLVTLRQVQIVTSEFLKIPLSVLSVNIEEALNSLNLIKGRVIGQDHIIDAAATSIAAKRQERKRLEDLARKRGEEFFAKPIWSAMLAGSTGTGKTEIAKQIAKQLGIPESDLLRFDMNEFQEKHSISRLIGSPPGYVGYDAGGALTNAVMEREYRVILFDEIEKAAPEIFTALMTMLDEGHMTDSQGRKVRFGNTIIIFTTNLGQQYTVLNRAQLFSLAKERMQELDVTLPELEKMNEMQLRLTLFKGDARARWDHAQVARIDDMLMTNNHTSEAIEQIVRNLFKQLVKDYADFDKVKLVITDAALKQIEDSYKVTTGARGVKDAYKKMVTDPLNILAPKLTEGDVVTIAYIDGKMDYIVTSKEDFKRARSLHAEELTERRRLIREELHKNYGDVGPKQETTVSGRHPKRLFSREYQVHDVMVHVLRRFRK
jgi:ATP-dependent Clp protease ATP-binding subunit ClpB